MKLEELSWNILKVKSSIVIQGLGSGNPWRSYNLTILHSLCIFVCETVNLLNIY